MALKNRNAVLLVVTSLITISLGIPVWHKVSSHPDDVHGPASGAKHLPSIASDDPLALSENLDENSGAVKAALPLFHRMSAVYIRGAEPGTGGVELLSRLGVKTIVDLRSKYDRTERIGKEAQRVGLRYYSCPLSVWDPPTDEETTSFLSVVTDPSKTPVFVFCADGVNRTGEMTAIYRVRHDHLTAEQAVREMDELGFSPYYYSLRTYVWEYTRERYPTTVTAKSR